MVGTGKSGGELKAKVICSAIVHAYIAIMLLIVLLHTHTHTHTRGPSEVMVVHHGLG